MSTCYIIATPIGNLHDLSPRAREVLQSVKRVFAEDTRVSSHLFRHFGIQTPLTSLHEHNEISRIEQLEQVLSQGESVAIISDAGTPLISDPGYPVVVALRKKGFPVIPIPGPSAVITALSVAGIPTDRFAFEGFLPAKSGQRVQALQTLAKESRTLIFYDSSHRIVAMLEDLTETFGAERVGFVGREMTKRFEDYRYGTLAELLAHYRHNPGEVRGEFVVVTAGAPAEKRSAETVDAERLLTVLLAENLPLKQISNIGHKILGRPKNELYQHLLTLREKE